MDTQGIKAGTSERLAVYLLEPAMPKINGSGLTFLSFGCSDVMLRFFPPTHCAGKLQLILLVSVCKAIA